jgi:hypothetical protein
MAVNDPALHKLARPGNLIVPNSADYPMQSKLLNVGVTISGLLLTQEPKRLVVDLSKRFLKCLYLIIWHWFLLTAIGLGFHRALSLRISPRLINERRFGQGFEIQYNCQLFHTPAQRGKKILELAPNLLARQGEAFSGA